MVTGLGTYLSLAAVLFGIGAAGFLARRNLLLQLMSIEIMLNPVNLALVSINRAQPGSPPGPGLAFFVIPGAPRPGPVGLAILISVFRLKKSVESDRADLLKG